MTNFKKYTKNGCMKISTLGIFLLNQKKKFRNTRKRLREVKNDKHTEIHKIKIENEIRYIAKMYVTYRDEMIDSFSSNYLEKVVEYLISKEYVITNYFNMTEMEE